jgi:excisionase family DNA binding protein
MQAYRSAAKRVSPLLLTPEQAAETIGLGRTRTYALIGSGELVSVKIGKSRRVPLSEAEAYVSRLVTAAVGARA